jgi:hypothetical protein
MYRMLLLGVVAALVAAPAPAIAQLLDGGVAGGGPQSDVATDVAMDAEGNMFISGTFNGTATFGDHSITAADDDPNNTWSDAYLVKFNADGEAQWARRGGTGIFNSFGNAVATGPDGSVFWTGYTTALSTFDGGDNDDGELMAVASWEAFIAKYDNDGNLLWVDGLVGSGDNTGQAVAVDPDGYVYFAAIIDGTASIGGQSFSAISGRDGFLVKLDPDGEAVWGIAVGGSQTNAAYDVAVHPEGGVVLSGQFRGVATFGDIPLQSSGLTDTFAARIDADGDVVWATKLGAQGDDYNRGLAVAPDGAIYLTGSFEQEILVGTDILVSPNFSTVYVARLNPDGSPAWGRRIGGTGFDFGESLAVDAEGNVYATGYVDGAFVVSTGDGDENHQTAGDNDGYLAVYSPEGELLSFETIGGTNRDRGQGVALNDEVGRVAVAGWFRATMTVGDDELVAPGGNSTFLAYGDTYIGPIVAGEDAPLAGTLSLSVYPNPAVASGVIALTVDRGQDVRVELFDMLGRRLAVLHDGTATAGAALELSLDASALPAGVYVVRATGETVQATRRVTVVR